MKTQTLLSLVLYASLTACGADSASGPLVAVSVTEQKPAEEKPLAEKKVESTPAEETTVKDTVVKKADTRSTAEAVVVATAESSSPVKALKLTSESCIDPALSEIKAGVQIMLCDGTLATGSLTAPSAPDLSNLTAANVKSGVTIAGVTGSLVVPTAPDLSNLTAANVKSGVTIAGVTGSLVVPVAPDLSNLLASNVKSGVEIAGVTGSYVAPSIANCSANNEVGCVTTATFKAADLSNLTAANLKTGVTVAGVSGSLVVEAHADCTADNQTGCIATASHKAVNTTNIVAANLKSGVTIAGVTGSYVAPTIAECSANNEVGCVTTASYKAADLSNLAAANLKSGVTVAGVTGVYPSASAPLAAATGTADLDTATFMAKIKADAEFEYFDSTGARHVQTGNALLSAENVRQNISLFNITGTLVAAVAPDAWDVRYGTTVAGVTGKLRAHCRTFDGNGGASVPAAEKCLDADIWQDLTSTVSAHATCAAASGQCLFFNRVSKLYFSRGYANATKSAAAIACSDLTYGGYDDWRLPSTEEAIQAATMGAASLGFLNNVNANWSNNRFGGLDYATIMANAVADNSTGDSRSYFCVRK